MSNKIKTTSSLSADSTEVRYQKALKQINKLIGINTEQREEILRYEATAADLRDKIQEMEEYLGKTMNSYHELEGQVDDMRSIIHNLQEENQELREENNRIRNSSLQAQNKIKRAQPIEVTNLLNDKSRQIGELEKMLQNKDDTIRQLNRKITTLEEISRDYEYSKIVETSVLKNEASKHELEKKLQVANQYIKKLTDQFADYKYKTSKNQLLNVKSAGTLPKYNGADLSPRISLNSFDSQLSSPMLKRCRKLEEENKKLTKKLQNIKKQSGHAITTSSQMQKDNAKMASQISCFEKLIEKQQTIIAEMNEKYNQDIVKMTNEFKNKLNQQRQSFSPAKSGDLLRQIQSLQIQNKSLKKKFQLCSIELTKCFKTLEVYKQKLNECERDYSEVINKNQELVDRLSKMQAITRERSRGSTSRIMDNDRRNSMGETGHFNNS